MRKMFGGLCRIKAKPMLKNMIIEMLKGASHFLATFQSIASKIDFSKDEKTPFFSNKIEPVHIQRKNA